MIGAPTGSVLRGVALTLTAVGMLSMGHGARGSAPAQPKPTGQDDGCNPKITHHVVTQGDTLWALCDLACGKPWLWPRVWALNPDVTNPHWLYPGDVIRFTNMTPNDAPLETRTLPGAYGPLQAHAMSPPVGTTFVRAEALEGAARLKDALSERLLLRDGDGVFINFGQVAPPSAGTCWQVARPVEQVHHPQTGRLLGFTVQVVAEVVLQGQAWAGPGHEEPLVAGTLRHVAYEVERGQLVLPIISSEKAHPPDADAKPVNAVIVALEDDREVAAAGALVFIDKGSKERVAVGDRFAVYLERRRDSDFKAVSPTQSALLRVVEVSDTTATCLVLHAAREIMAGDAVRSVRQAP